MTKNIADWGALAMLMLIAHRLGEIVTLLEAAP